MDRLANLRDVGGLPTVDGRRTRPGVLLRSDAPQPGDAPPAEVAWPPRLVLDLRSPDELGEPHPLTGVADEVRSLPLSADAQVDRIADRHEDLAALYRHLVEARVSLVVDGVRALAGGDGPALVHCAAGKDRTGVLIAVVLAALGVERRAVLADYAATSDNIDDVVARIRRDPAAEDKFARLVAERPQYLETPVDALAAALDAIEAEHGDVRSWLLAHGLEPDALERLEARLLTAA